MKKNTIFHTLKNRAKIEKKMQENYEKLYISFGNVVQMVLPIIKVKFLMQIKLKMLNNLSALMLKHEIINELKRNIDEREIKTWEYTQSKEKFDIIYHNPPQYKDDPQKNVIFKLEIIGEDLVFSTAYWTNKSTPSHEMYALHVGRLTEMLLTYFYDKFIRYEIVNFIG